jgi:glycosyltransferase involved in cell wall biosynthesis
MRIGLVVTGGFDRSGRERVVPTLLWLVERLARHHQVHVFVIDYYREPCDYPLLGATIHDIGRVPGAPGLRRFRVRRLLAAAIRAHSPFDVLHAYLGVPSAIVSPIAQRLGIPTVLSLASGEFVALEDIGYGMQRRWVDRYTLARAAAAATRVTVDTAFMANLAAARGVGTRVIPLGIDTRVFPMTSRTEGPPWRLLRVASLNPVKDYPTLLLATGSIVRRGLDVRLDIVGEDTMNGAIQELTRTLGLEERVAFHGFQPTDRLAGFYARAHLHVSPSRHEGAGVVMLEAASTGLVSIGSAVGHLSDWSDVSASLPERGVAVAPQAPQALADAIVDLLSDRPRRERIAAAARDWTLAHDADWTARQFDALYAEAARSK